MPEIHLCFLWHMHQPFYKDLISGEYKLPWTRLHALKDYYGMVRTLEEFPRVRQTFNLVPSVVLQLQEYASGAALDPFLHCALKPAESLNRAEQDFILRHFFNAYAPRMIYRYPRYGDLYEAWQARKNMDSAAAAFAPQDFRDLQVLSQIAWFDEEFLDNDAEVVALVAKGRHFDLADQELMGRKQREILKLVLPAYQRLAASGQIEISTTPFYHPILPLICDSNIASVSHPGLTLPARFRYPEDALYQLTTAREFISRELGVAPVGLWPSEGSVSDEALALAADAGYSWTASDNGVLDRTLGGHAGVFGGYRPYRWRQGNRSAGVIFRDHLLSDLIGFVYSRMDAREAAREFLSRIRENCREILARGQNALVPIILDGENAWEYYERNGRPFLRELYGRISEDPQMRALTVREALERTDPVELDHIFPGSWINANFDVWIGHEEDNRAWEYLLRARQTFEASKDAPGVRLDVAHEELLIAEGSDWCWWYGPEHESENRADFDLLYRGHLANVYRALGLTPPEELSRPILKVTAREFHSEPAGPIHPVIDGEVSSYFEWLGAGVYRVDARSGSMHGRQFPVREIHYGRDEENFFLRMDFQDLPEEVLRRLEVRLSLRAGDAPANLIVIRPGTDVSGVRYELRTILEVAVSLSMFGWKAGELIRFQCSIWDAGLPLEALPHEGWLSLR